MQSFLKIYLTYASIVIMYISAFLYSEDNFKLYIGLSKPKYSLEMKKNITILTL